MTTYCCRKWRSVMAPQLELCSLLMGVIMVWYAVIQNGFAKKTADLFIKTVLQPLQWQIDFFTFQLS